MSKKQIANDHGPRIELAESIPAGTDALVLGLIAAAEEDDTPTLLLPEDLLDDAAAEGISSALAAIGATGSAGEVRRIPAPAGVSATTVVTVGIGKAADLDDPEQIRRAAGVVARELDGVTSAATTLSTADVAATVEGLILGAYRFDDFRSERTAPKKAAVEAVTLIVDRKPGKARKQAERAAVVADAVALARDFVNTPPSHLYPAEFAERSRKLAREVGLTVEVLDEKELAKQGYGGIVGVGQGSSRPPRLVRLTHTGKSKAAKVALVGKGITFDTGGISIKPAANMDQMTSDMGGAAAVIATMIAVARLDLDVSVTATVPMAENMPSSTAQRPGDVLTQYGGTTVEVLNTDAEGRLILADAIVRACEDDPDYLIDTATLTGAQMVALGARTPGVMGTEEFRDRVARCSADTGENAWAMPLPEELRDDLKSRVADLANITPHRWGGMLAAGVYLREFVADDVAWAHIDIAGPAFNSGSPWGYTTKGGTGVPVRTMLAVLEDIEADG